jgi:site-specific DNA-methyltransferase (adenine-specific)
MPKFPLRNNSLISCGLPTAKLFYTKSGIVAASDALDFLRSIPPSVGNIVFLDPPFNLGKSYGRKPSSKDKRIAAHYYQFMRSIIFESMRVLKDGGALYLYHLPQWALRFGELLDIHMMFRHWIAIAMKNGFARGRLLYPAHYALLYFTKGTPNSFHKIKVEPSRCRHCGEYIHDYGGYVDFIRKGVNLSDFWDDLSPVRHKSKKTRPANELPIELARRAIKISSVKGGLLIDPFVGSGTTIATAIESKMNYLACDREETYCRLATKRASMALSRINNTNKSTLLKKA